MPPTDNQPVVTLPQELRQKFVDLERRLWTLETVAAVCSVLAGLVLSYLILFMSDRLWDTPVWLRVIISAGGAGVFIWFGFRWSSQWILKRRDLRALSNLVQKKYRRLGDRLLGIVELVEEQHHSPDYSPALYRAAIQQVAAEATPLDFREAVDLRPGKLSVLALIGLLALALVPLALVPAAGWNALMRWAAPTAAITRYTLVGLDGLPAQQIVAHGESFEITGSVHYRSF